MSLYPSSIVCHVCDRLLSRAWNENSRCKCDDEPAGPKAVQELGREIFDATAERARRRVLGIRT